MARSNRVLYRVMLDTSVLIAGTIWRRWPYEVLQHARRHDYRLVLAPVIVAEAAATFRRRFPRYLSAFQTFLGDCPYEEAADPTRDDIIAQRSLMRDINDVPIALAAIQSGVDYLLSEDKDFTEPTPSNAELHARLRIRLPGTFLREVMGWSSIDLEAVRGR